LDLAGQSLREATESDTSLWRAWNGLGDLADKNRQPKVAAGFYAKALALRPNSAMIINNIGYSLLQDGNIPQSVVEFRKALALDPNNITTQTNLSLALAASGNYAEALRSTPPEQLPDLLNNVGYMAMRRGDYAAAERYLASAMETSSTVNTEAAKNLDRLKERQQQP
jgi:Flp pilus assembly protein TadD